MQHGLLRSNTLRAATLVAAQFLASIGFADSGTTDLPIGDPVRASRQAPVVLDGITDTATGELIAPAELARRLADTRLLFIGEQHTDLDFHRVQLRVIEALHEAGVDGEPPGHERPHGSSGRCIELDRRGIGQVQHDVLVAAAHDLHLAVVHVGAGEAIAHAGQADDAGALAQTGHGSSSFAVLGKVWPDDAAGTCLSLEGIEWPG